MTLFRFRCFLQLYSVRLLLALSLLGAQWAGQLHALSHVKHDLVAAAYIKAGGGADKPSLDHGREQCVVFQGLDCSPASLQPPMVASHPGSPGIALPQALIRPAGYPPYSSRAPPVFS